MSKLSIPDAVAFINAEIAPLYAGQFTQQLFEDALAGGVNRKSFLKIAWKPRKV